ncbi:MAG: flagellar basal body P-ring formation chaperone FlgA [Pseudomonadota bacterium]
MSMRVGRPPIPRCALLWALALQATFLLCILGGTAARGEDVPQAARLLAPGTILAPADLVMPEDRGNQQAARALVGMRLRRAMPAGARLSPADVAAPYVVRRNAIVTMRFAAGPLMLETEGRALDDAALGAPLRVMNLTSRETVDAVAAGSDRVEVMR